MRRRRVRFSPADPKLPQTFPTLLRGCMQTGLSNLIFNQACAGSSPAIPIRLRVGCSSTAERRTVDAKTTSSILASRPKTFTRGALGESGSSRLSLNQESNGSNPLRAIKFSWSCGREVRHSVVNGADEGSSPSSSALSCVARRKLNG